MSTSAQMILNQVRETSSFHSIKSFGNENPDKVFFFLRLAVDTEQRIDSAQTLSDRFAFRASFYLPEVQATYEEYLMVPGFDDKKAALGAFISEATHQARRSPGDGT